MFHCYRGIWFCKLDFIWLHFICKILQIMEAQAALFWKCFNVLPKYLQGGTTEELKTFQEMLQAVDPKETSPWQASRVYAALTLQKTLVRPKDLLHLVRTNLAMILGKDVDLPKAEKVREDLYKALEAFSSEARVEEDDACKAPEYVWQEKQPKLPSTWKALTDDMETLQVSSKRATILIRVPVFDAILRVPTNNAPHTPHGDTEKAAWDRQVRDVMRVLATARLQENTPEVLTALGLEAPSSKKLLDTAFALLASLSFSIECSRKLTVNRSLDTSSKSTPLLFGKEDVQLLQHRQSLLKHFQRASSYRTQPYHRDYRREYGKGKGKGRGKGKGAFRPTCMQRDKQRDAK